MNEFLPRKHYNNRLIPLIYVHANEVIGYILKFGKVWWNRFSQMTLSTLAVIGWRCVEMPLWIVARNNYYTDIPFRSNSLTDTIWLIQTFMFLL